METQTAVMRRRVHRIGRGYRSAHRRPVPADTRSRAITGASPAGVSAAPPSPPTVEVRYESPVPHAAWIIGGWLLTLAAGVALGVGVATVLG